MNVVDDKEGTSPPALWSSVRVYALADKYGVVSLKDVAKERFAKWIEKNYLSDQLPALVKEVFETTPPTDMGLRDIVAKTLAKHITIFLQQESWSRVLEASGQLCRMALVKLAEVRHCEHTDLKDRIINLEMAVETLDGQKESLGQRHENLCEKLNNRRQCRHCAAPFNMCIDDLEPGILRCRECRTRH